VQPETLAAAYDFDVAAASVNREVRVTCPGQLDLAGVRSRSDDEVELEIAATLVVASSNAR